MVLIPLARQWFERAAKTKAVAYFSKQLFDRERRRLKSEVFGGYGYGFYFYAPSLRPFLFNRSAGLGQRLNKKGINDVAKINQPEKFICVRRRP